MKKSKTIKFFTLLAGLLLSVNVLATDCSVVSDGLVACYPFNGSASDDSGNDYHGQINGASLTTDRFGFPNSAYRFDGINDSIVSDASLSSSKLTASAWVLLEAHRCWGGILDAFQEKWEFVMNCGNGDKLEFAQWRSNGSFDEHIDSQIIPLSQWYHVVVTINDLEGAFYINGVQSSSFLLDSLALINPESMIMGHSRSGSSQYFKGVIDDVRLYDRALLESEIRELYNESSETCGKPSYDSSTRELHIPCVIVDGVAEYEVDLGAPFNILKAIPK